MNGGSRNKNLLIIIAVLLLTNIAVLGYFLWYKKAEKPPTQQKSHNGMAEVLQKEVGFDEQQVTRYKEMREQQRQKIKPMFDEMRKIKDNFFQLLREPGTSDSTVQKAADAIATQQREIDLQAFRYFRDLRALCRPDQYARYDSVVMDAMSKMGRPMKKTDDEKKK